MVTGGGSGIGKGACERIAAEWWKGGCIGYSAASRRSCR